MSKTKSRRIAIVITCGWLLTALGILAIGLNLVSSEFRSSMFWPRLLWTEFLALLVWSTLFSFVGAASRSDDDSRAVVGVLPGAKIVLLVYAILSFALLMVHSCCSETTLNSRVHLILQIVIGVGTGIAFTLFSISCTGASVGLQRVFHPGSSPEELSNVVHEQEMRVHQFPIHPVWQRLEKCLKGLRELLQYSMPHTGDIGTDADYNGFAASLISACEDLSSHNDPADSEVSVIEIRFNDLLAKARIISSQSIKR